MPIVSRFGWLCLLAVASAQEPVSQQPDLRPAVPSVVPAVAATSIGSAQAAPSKVPGKPDARVDAAKLDGKPEPVALRADHGADHGADRGADVTPPAPKDGSFSVPEAQTLLIVGTGLVLVALAKRRVRIGPVTVVR